MNLHYLTDGQKHTLTTRAGKKAKIVDIFPDGKVLVKVVGRTYPYQVTPDGFYREDEKESDADIMIGTAKRRIRIYVYDDGSSTWHDENQRFPPSHSKVLLKSLLSEI